MGGEGTNIAKLSTIEATTSLHPQKVTLDKQGGHPVREPPPAPRDAEEGGTAHGENWQRRRRRRRRERSGQGYGLGGRGAAPQ